MNKLAFGRTLLSRPLSPLPDRQLCAVATRHAAQVSAQVLRGLPEARRAAVLDRLAAVRLYAVGAHLRCAPEYCGLGHRVVCVVYMLSLSSEVQQLQCGSCLHGFSARQESESLCHSALL